MREFIQFESRPITKRLDKAIIPLLWDGEKRRFIHDGQLPLADKVALEMSLGFPVVCEGDGP